MNRNSGMTRIQLIIFIALVIIIGVFSYPPYAEYKKVTQADTNVETLAIAIKKYYKHTQQYPTSLEQLLTNPNSDSRRSAYLESIPETPWGGKIFPPTRSIQSRYCQRTYACTREIPNRGYR